MAYTSNPPSRQNSERFSQNQNSFITETINFSTAKQKYSFGKEARFPQMAKILNHEVGYKLPQTNGKRACGFGIGNRFKTPITTREASPPPDTYQLPSDFDVGKQGCHYRTKAGVYSFGVGHAAYEKVFLKATKKTDPVVPGPGQYAPKNYTMGTEGRNFNFQSRSKNFNDPEFITIRSNTPGPGTYDDVIRMSKHGNSPVSTISNSKAANWSPSKQRFAPDNMSMRDTPGPGQYTPSDCVSGNYLLSTIKNNGQVRMVQDMKPGRLRQRQHQTKLETPGPGTYQAQSDFGNYKQLFYRSDRKKGNFGIITSDWNYSSLSPNKFDSDVSLESPMLGKGPYNTRPVSQLEKLNGTMRAQRLMKLVPSQEINSEKSGTACKTMNQRVNTVNQFHQTGKLKNIKLINNQQNKLNKQGSENFSNSNNFMYLATNDVQSGDYQQSSSQNHTIGHHAKSVRKQNKINDSTLTKIGIYAAASVRNNNNYFINGSNKKKFTQIRRNSIVNPQVYSRTPGIFSE